mgnify:CR=1 FL=1
MDIGGQPKKFEDVEELEGLIVQYFQSLEKEDNEGKVYYLPATITGLALALGFCSRQSVYDYEKDDRFSYIIKKARLMVENGYEKSLFSKHSTGAIFALKNMGWRDKQEVDNTHAFVGASPITFGDNSTKD